MKEKLLVTFVALLCISLGFSSSAAAGPNADASVKVKLLRDSQISTWTSATAAADTLLDINEGESFWVKLYAVNVSSLVAWEVRLTVNPNFLMYDPDNAANYNLSMSAAGEKGILLLKDESGLTDTDILTFNFFDEDSGRVTLSQTFNSGSIQSNPALDGNTGFLAEVKLTAKAGVTVGNSDIISATTVIFAVSDTVSDEVSASANPGTVTFTPIELASFSSIVIGENDVKLEWVTTSETNNLGFYVERSVDGEIFETVAFIDGKGTTGEEVSYAFIDEEMPVGTYYYRLKQVDYSGAVSYSDIIEVAVAAPSEYALAQNYPNPFNPITNIEFSLMEAGFVELKVYNVVGQLVATLANRNMEAGYHTIHFNASRLASGIYFYAIKANNFRSIKKMTLMK